MQIERGLVLRNGVAIAAQQTVGKGQLEMRGVVFRIGGGGLGEEVNRAVILLGVDRFVAVLENVRGLRQQRQKQEPHTPVLILLRQVEGKRPKASAAVSILLVPAAM